MPYYDVANLVTLTKTNQIHEMPCGYRTLRTTAVRNTALSLPQSCAEVWSCSRSLSCSKIWLSYKSNLVASWMHLHNCRCFQEHLRMLLQSLRALCSAPGGPGSIWNHFGAPVRSTGVSGRFACGFRTDLHFADVIARDQRLVTSRLYKSDITRPWTHHMQPCGYIIPLFRCRPPGLHKPVQE